MTTGGIDKAKTGIEIVGEVIRLAGDDPNVKEAGSELGKTALTVTKTINNALMPLAAVNFAFDKARHYFADKFENDLSKKAQKIPTESLIEPKASIAGPALQGLAFAHEEEDLKDLFLELIAGSMDRRRTADAHPAFVEILRQLEAEEARLLKAIIPTDIISVAQLVRRNKDNGSTITIKPHVLDMRNSVSKQPALIENLPVIVDNWIRLGLVSVDYTHTLAEPSMYDWLNDRPELKSQGKEPDDSKFSIDWIKGILYPTELGKQFGRAVGITS